MQHEADISADSTAAPTTPLEDELRHAFQAIGYFGVN